MAYYKQYNTGFILMMVAISIFGAIIARCIWLGRRCEWYTNPFDEVPFNELVVENTNIKVDVMDNDNDNNATLPVAVIV